MGMIPKLNEVMESFRNNGNGSETKMIAIIQTEAERRRREAGVIQWIEKGSGHVYMLVYMYEYVCFSRIYHN